MSFERIVDKADHTVSHGEISEEIPEEDLMDEIDNDVLDMPDSAVETDKISTESEVQPFKMALLKMVETLWLMVRDIKEAIIIFAVFISIAHITVYLMGSPIIYIGKVEANATSLCPDETKCNITLKQVPHNFETVGSFVRSYRTLYSCESPYHTNEQPAIAMAMTCKHKECERKGSGYRIAGTGKCIRRVCKCGNNTTEFQPTEACNDLYDSCAAQVTLSYGFDCDDGVLKYCYNTVWSQSAEEMSKLCDSCAALLTLTFGFDCDDGVSKYGYNTTGFQTAEATNNSCDPCDTRFFQPIGIECDDEVFSGEVEALGAEVGGGVSIRVSTTVVVERKGSTEKNASEKYDDKVSGSKTEISTINTEL